MPKRILICLLLALFCARSVAAQAYRLPLISQTVAAQQPFMELLRKACRLAVDVVKNHNEEAKVGKHFEFDPSFA